MQTEPYNLRGRHTDLETPTRRVPGDTVALNTLRQTEGWVVRTHTHTHRHPPTTDRRIGTGFVTLKR